MRYCRNGLLAFCVLAASGAPALAQEAPAPVEMVPPPSWMFNDLACAPILTKEPPGTLRVIGSQDSTIRYLLGPGDTLVISGGSAAGLQPGQQYYVRRNVTTFGARKPGPDRLASVHTAGWVRILGVDATVATATVVGACDGILPDDYLEPFTPPTIAARAVPGSTPQYAAMGRVLTGDEGMQNVGGAGQLINIDRGSSHGVVPGQRYLVFRDKRSARTSGYPQGTQNLPLVEVGEVMVISVREETSTVQVVVARDAIATGDLLAEIR